MRRAVFQNRNRMSSSRIIAKAKKRAWKSRHRGVSSYRLDADKHQVFPVQQHQYAPSAP